MFLHILVSSDVLDFTTRRGSYISKKTYENILDYFYKCFLVEVINTPSLKKEFSWGELGRKAAKNISWLHCYCSKRKGL